MQIKDFFFALLSQESATYQIRARNEYGEDTSSAEVEVRGGPAAAAVPAAPASYSAGEEMFSTRKTVRGHPFKTLANFHDF